MSADPQRVGACVCAIADAFAGDGEILASPMGRVPTLGARLARLHGEPDLLLGDGVASLLAEVPPLGEEEGAAREGALPYRRVFDILWSGKRHVVMGAAQIDRYGNQNISAIGDWRKPRAMLLGVRGAPGNTLNHPTSYWVGAHSRRVFVPEVDVVCGVGYQRAASLGPAARYHEIRAVVSNLAVMDFDTEDRRMRLRSLHPGVSLERVVQSTGFELVIPDDLPTTRTPTEAEWASLRRLDPQGLAAGDIAP